MTAHQPLVRVPTGPRTDSIIKLAVLAVGGQGGGVLTGWIEALARANGYDCQATSVAGVAQRTGATVYYVEMCPTGDRQPVFNLMPAAGDVDVMITAEMMEAGRAIIRGFVTPDRTTLITSTHRALAVSEKIVPGDGIASSAEVIAAAEVAARRVIAADFDAVAVTNGSVISATLFGALAASETLPFSRAAFEAAIRAGGKGVEASVRAFAAGFDAALAGQPDLSSRPLPQAPVLHGPDKLITGWKRLGQRLEALPAPAQDLARAGLQKVVNYQDLAYGEAYIDRLVAIAAKDRAPYDLTREAAKYAANAMSYDDVIRVADLKTRGDRFTRIRDEMGVNDSQILHLTEFFHPRAEEIAGLLPLRWGTRVQASPKAMARLDRWFNHGRRLRTDSLPAYLALYLIGGLRRYRLRTLRHAQETAHLDAWLATAMSYVPSNYDLAVEVIRCRRLIKGYSDTHARGLSKYDRVLGGIAQVAGRPDAADWARRLRDAALKDEEGKALDGALMTIASFD